MNLIDHIIEPQKLYLVWQPSVDSAKARIRRIVGELLRKNSSIVFRYLLDHPDFVEARNHGFDSYPSLPLKSDSLEYTNDILGFFCRRLPPRSRPDFKKFLLANRVNPDAELSDFALLGYTEARLASDTFSIVNPFENVNAPCEVFTEVAGYRYYDSPEGGLNVGDVLSLHHEPDNIYDANAVRIEHDGRKIGYVNKVLSPTILRWLESFSVKVVMERIGISQGVMRAYIFITVR